MAVRTHIPSVELDRHRDLLSRCLPLLEVGDEVLTESGPCGMVSCRECDKESYNDVPIDHAPDCPRGIIITEIKALGIGEVEDIGPALRTYSQQLRGDPPTPYEQRRDLVDEARQFAERADGSSSRALALIARLVDALDKKK